MTSRQAEFLNQILGRIFSDFVATLTHFIMGLMAD